MNEITFFLKTCVWQWHVVKRSKREKNFLSEITQKCQTTLPPLNIILKFKSWNTKSTFIGEIHKPRKPLGRGRVEISPKLPRLYLQVVKVVMLEGGGVITQEMATEFMNGPIILIVLSPRTLLSSWSLFGSVDLGSRVLLRKHNFIV